jgi:hypothetical protein
MRSIIERATASDRTDRFQDAGLMRKSLDEFLYGRGGSGALNLGWYVQKLLDG